MGRYASDTTVSVERSRAEIEECLRRYGASAFTSGWDEDHDTAMIAFNLKQLFIRFVLPIPRITDKRFQYRIVRKQSVRATENQADRAWEQECKQRWRALGLVVKAKLEAVECGISSLEREFMAFIVLPNDQTLGEWVAKHALEAIRAGKMPLALEARKEPIQDAEVTEVK